MAQEQKKTQEATEQSARERDIGETMTRLNERQQALLEGFAMGLMACEIKQAG